MQPVGQLAALIAESTDGRDGVCETRVPGVYASRLSSALGVPRHNVDRAVFCVVAQGAKSIMLNGERYVYDPSKYLILSLDLPLVGEIVEASAERPFLGVSMELDFAAIGSLLLEVEPDSNTADGRSIFVSPMDDDMLDAVIRLLKLAKKPADVPVLAPLIRREIFYKLLKSEHGGLLRRMTADNRQMRRIAAGIEYLKRNVARTIRMDDLAREVHMSPSTMNYWFKSVTSMSPLQFQKQLRLQEARRILLSESSDAASASRRVGYESPSQFSREYRRFFGLPPLQDIERLRAVPELVRLQVL